MDDRVAFSLKIPGGTVFVTGDGEIAYCFTGSAGPEQKSILLRETLPGRKGINIEGAHPSETRISSFKGRDPSHWRSNIPCFHEVRFGEVYPGIRMHLAAVNRNVEKVFLLRPSADPGAIRIRVHGAESLAADDSGRLCVKTALGEIAFTRPVAFQPLPTGPGNQMRRRFIEAAYRIEGLEYGFALGDLDPALPVVIDPLFASTYLGGSDIEGEWGSVDSVVDPHGNIYVASITHSMDFPTTPGAYAPNFIGGDSDIFVSKLSGDLKCLLASTFIGGTGTDVVPSITLDKDGNVFIAGSTSSKDFPVVAGCFDVDYNGGTYDYFVAKLDGDLETLHAATYVGGTNQESPYYSDIVSSPSGDVFVVGNTKSYNFPTSPTAYDKTWNGSSDAVIFRLDSNLKTLVASTFLGGNKDENFPKIDLDGLGNVFVSGATSSTNFPTTPGAYQTVYMGGHYDVFVSKLDNGLTTLQASTLIGGSDPLGEACFSVELDASGNVYISGHTAPGYPTTPGVFDEIHNGDNEGYVSKFNNDLSSLLASTFLSPDEQSGCVCDNLAWHGQGYIYGSGYTWSPDFPVTANAFDKTFNGVPYETIDGILIKLDDGLVSLEAATFLGGSAIDAILRVDLTADGKVFASGKTDSPDFPVSPDASQQTFGGQQDVFVSKLDGDLSANPFLMADAGGFPASTGGTINFVLTAGEDHAGRTYLLLGGVSGTFPGTTLPGGLVLPLNWDAFTNLVLAYCNTTLFFDFLGNLDAKGTGKARLNAPPAPGLTGTVMHYAYCLNKPFDFTSNPVAVEITP